MTATAPASGPGSATSPAGSAPNSPAATAAPAGAPVTSVPANGAAQPGGQLPFPVEPYQAGKQVPFSGSGCAPHSTFTVLATASHASGRVLAQGTTTTSGRFLITVTIPNMGQPQADLVGQCDNSTGTTITVDTQPYDLVHMSAPIRIAPDSRVTVSGSGCTPGSPVMIGSIGDPRPTVLGSGTATAAGTFSVATLVPRLGASDLIFAACRWPGDPSGAETAYPTIIPVTFTSIA